MMFKCRIKIKYPLTVLVFALFYFFISVYLSNIDLINKTLFGQFTPDYKMNILWALVSGINTSMSSLSISILLITSLLTGLNFTLLIKRLRILRSMGNMKVIAGGGSLLALASGGCVSCGLPIVSFLGFGSSVSVLPFHGSEFSLLSIILLTISSFFLIQQIKENSVCEIRD